MPAERLAWLGSVTPGGSIFAGLWYPIIVALMTVVIGGICIRETKDVRIWDEVGGHQDDLPATRREETAVSGGSLAG